MTALFLWAMTFLKMPFHKENILRGVFIFFCDCKKTKLILIESNTLCTNQRADEEMSELTLRVIGAKYSSFTTISDKDE